MASTTATDCPAETISPMATSMETTVPGIGDISFDDRSSFGFSGISDWYLAAFELMIETSNTVPEFLLTLKPHIAVVKSLFAQYFVTK